MARKITLSLVIIICALSAGAQSSLKIMSYNIRNGIGIDNSPINLTRTAGVIDSVSPDIVAIQEVDSVTRRNGKRHTLAEIASQTGMYATFAPAISYDGGKYGVGILSRKKPLGHKTVPLPGREEARVLLITEFPDFIFACTHLSLTEEDRSNSLAIIEREAQSSVKPFFIAGDFNAHPKDDFMVRFSKEFTILSPADKFTFPADKPEETIDYIAVSKLSDNSVIIQTSEVVNEPLASDHRPIVVVVTRYLPEAVE